MRIIDGPVKPAFISELITENGKYLDAGSCFLFLGQVRRDISDGKMLSAIEFSAYEEMVIMEANKIIKTVSSEFDDIRFIEIIHSRGKVETGETYLLVMAAAEDSRQAMNACEKAALLVIEKLPVVKKELFEEKRD